MYAFTLIAILVSYATAERRGDAAVDLLNVDFSGFKDVQRTKDSVSFGSKTGDLDIDRQSIRNIVKHSKDFKDRTLFLKGKLRNAEFGKNTLVFLNNPLSNRVYFEVSIEKERVFRSFVEGSMESKIKKTVNYNLVFTYTSNGRQVEKVFSISNRFKEDKWFTLAVRVLGDSDIEVIFDCELLERAKLFLPMDSIPSYLAGRLAQSVQRDIFTLNFVPHQRFVDRMMREGRPPPPEMRGPPVDPRDPRSQSGPPREQRGGPPFERWGPPDPRGPPNERRGIPPDGRGIPRGPPGPPDARFRPGPEQDGFYEGRPPPTSQGGPHEGPPRGPNGHGPGKLPGPPTSDNSPFQQW